MVSFDLRTVKCSASEHTQHARYVYEYDLNTMISLSSSKLIFYDGQTNDVENTNISNFLFFYFYSSHKDNAAEHLITDSRLNSEHEIITDFFFYECNYLFSLFFFGKLPFDNGHGAFSIFDFDDLYCRFRITSGTACPSQLYSTR